jgi:hypothetical protein
VQDLPLKPLVFSLNDSLMLLAPRGWSTVELALREHGGALRLAELKAGGEGATEARPRAPVQVEPEHEAAHLAEGLTELQQRLAGAWRPGGVTVQRTPGSAVDWRLTQGDGQVAWFTRLEAAELASLLVTEELLDLVTGTSRAFEVLQAQLGQRLGPVTGFQFDSGRCVLRLERPAGVAELPALVLGAYLPGSFTWVWGWSDPESAAPAVEAVRRICAPDAAQDGLSALWRASYHCDEGFAWTVAGSVAVSLGARGLFRGALPDGSGAAFFAVLELPPPSAA